MNFSASISDLSRFFRALELCAGEAQVFADGVVHSTVVDPSHCTLARAEAQFEVGEQGECCVEVRSAMGALSSLKKVLGGQAEVTVRSDGHLVHFEHPNSSMAVPNYQAPEKQPKVPAITMSLTAEVDKKGIAGAIDAIASNFTVDRNVAPSLRLYSSEGALYVGSGEDTRNAEGSARFRLAPCEGEASAQFATDFMRDAVKAQAGDLVKIECGTNIPALVSSQADGISTIAFVAPRTDDAE